MGDRQFIQQKPLREQLEHYSGIQRRSHSDGQWNMKKKTMTTAQFRRFRNALRELDVDHNVLSVFLATFNERGIENYNIIFKMKFTALCKTTSYIPHFFQNRRSLCTILRTARGNGAVSLRTIASRTHCRDDSDYDSRQKFSDGNQQWLERCHQKGYSFDDRTRKLLAHYLSGLFVSCLSMFALFFSL